MDGNPIQGTRIYPTYTCGHCTSVVVMRENRERPRNLCLSCMKWICEKSELCNLQCTPLHALADDHFESSEKYGKLVPAIMSGVTTVKEGLEKGLILP